MCDFQVYWEAARAVLWGLSPYTVQGFVSAPIVAWLFIPLGLIWNVGMAATVFYTVNMIAMGCWAYHDPRIQSLKGVSFSPLIFLFGMGQIDLLVMVMGLWGGVPLLGLMVLVKPQLALVILAWKWTQWGRDERLKNLAMVAGVASAGWLAMGLVHPGWVMEWRAAAPAFQGYSSDGVSSWATSWSVLVAALTFSAFALSNGWKRGSTWWSAAVILNPMSRIYSLVALLPYLDWWAVGLSWAALGVGVLVNSSAVFVIVPLYLLWREAAKAMKVPDRIAPRKGRVWCGGYEGNGWKEGEVK